MIAPRLISSWSDFHSGLHLTPAELKSLQLARLRALVGFAYEKVPYYRKLFDSVGFQPRHLKQISDMEAIPVTTRERLESARPEEVIARGYSAAKLKQTRTSGSTGAPLTVYKSRHESWLGVLSRLRTWSYHGLKWNERILTINGRRSTAHERQWMQNLPVPWRWNLSIFDAPETMLAMLERLRPSVLYGYAFHVSLLASLASEQDLRDWGVRRVATSGTMLLPRFRNIIKDAFNVDPIDIYNSSELGDIGWQCQRREGFHLNADQLYVEFLRNGRCVGDGERGEVVATNCYRYAMPLIRYSLGDVAVPSDEPCGCGIGLPIMRRLEGRTLNVVPLANGRWFIGFLVIMSDFPELAKFQVVQKALDYFQVSVVPGANYSSDVLARIEKAISLQVGSGIRLEVRAVEARDLVEIGGKLAPVDFGNA